MIAKTGEKDIVTVKQFPPTQQELLVGRVRQIARDNPDQFAVVNRTNDFHQALSAVSDLTLPNGFRLSLQLDISQREGEFEDGFLIFARHRVLYRLDVWHGEKVVQDYGEMQKLARDIAAITPEGTPFDPEAILRPYTSRLGEDLAYVTDNWAETQLKPAQVNTLLDKTRLKLPALSQPSITLKELQEIMKRNGQTSIAGLLGV